MKHKLLAVLSVFILFIAAAPAVSHADELTGLTLEKEMRAMIEKGILQGYGENDFRPKGEVTREQFAAFLARTLELPTTEGNFIDVNPSTALAPFIGAIQQTGYMQGTTDNRFMPTKNITREEMALTMSRVIKDKQLTAEVKNISFEDQNKFTLTGGLEAAKLLASINVMSGGASNLGPTTFIFKPKDISTRDQVAAVLYRYLEFQKGTPIPDPEKPEKPEVDTNKFKVASIKNGKLVPSTTTYATYDQALDAFNKSAELQVLLDGTDIIRIKSGRAFGAANPKKYTSIYSDTALRNEITYIQLGREMKYIGSGPNYAIVMVGGTTGYVRHSEVDLVPDELVKGKDYYRNVDGMLTHYTYNNYGNPNNYYGIYTVGPSPSFMKANTNYYSYDGVQFYNDKDQLVGTHYPYFQFLSARTETTYTAAELDKYIVEKLADRQATGQAKYKDATKNSKLIGLGKHFKELEKSHRVNAMFILAVAIHESDYGISARALSCNNLFGIAAYDSNLKLCQRSFDTPGDSAVALVDEFMNRNYLNPQGGYPNGAVPGNKTVGVNVKYASDPNWGSKVAGHLWTIDSSLGGKEYNRHRLARITYYHATAGVNVRKTPVGDQLFRYKPKQLGSNDAFGYPLVIVDEKQGSDGYKWYQVIADINPIVNGSPTEKLGWIRSDLMKEIPK